MSGNQIHGKHALGARANKISQGILTVRFEMPFPIWCTHCPKPKIIGQGVRFNAEKKKVGNYYSSPIYSFRMKHVACGGWIEIRTDPKNTAYVVTEGARKRDLGEDKVEEGDIKILTQEEREAIRSSAFATLEVTIDQRKRLEASKTRLDELEELSEEQWEDPYEKNKRLRTSFRQARKQRERDASVAAALQDRMSLGLDILPENETDARHAKLIDFGGGVPNKDLAISKPLFGKESHPVTKTKSSKLSRKAKAEELSQQRTAKIVADIRGNTRIAMDPFLPGSRASSISKPRPTLIGVKRKLSDSQQLPTTGVGLVDYDSE